MSKQTYEDRNIIIKDMGYANYHDYLASPLWIEIRDRVYTEKGGKCIVCENIAQVIHHRGYGRDVLEGKTLSPLVPLCHKCHKNIEFTENDIKRSLNEVDAKLMVLLTSRHRKKPKVLGKCITCGKEAKKGEVKCRKCTPVIIDDIKCIICKVEPSKIKGWLCIGCFKTKMVHRKLDKKNKIKVSSDALKLRVKCACGNFRKSKNEMCNACMPKKWRLGKTTIGNKIKKVKKPKITKPGQRICQCGRRKRPGRKYCSWCWDNSTGRLRVVIT